MKGKKKGKDFEISFLLVDNDEMKKLNLQYRNQDKPTDVLAFPMLDEDDPLIPGQPLLLGDIVISTEKARSQAEGHKHSVKKEIMILLIHGLLHLLGYDHKEDNDEEEMKRKEKIYLEKAFNTIEV